MVDFIFGLYHCLGIISWERRLYDCLIDAGGREGRSVPKRANQQLYVLNATRMIAVLVEHGFMDSSSETSIILTEDYANRMASGWIAFFEEYLSISRS